MRSASNGEAARSLARALAVGASILALTASARAADSGRGGDGDADQASGRIFQENVSFDHYFATYPKAANPPGEPTFTAAAGTPKVNNWSTPSC